MAKISFPGTLVSFEPDDQVDTGSYLVGIRIEPRECQQNEDGTWTITIPVDPEDLQACKPNGRVRFDLHLNPRG